MKIKNMDRCAHPRAASEYKHAERWMGEYKETDNNVKYERSGKRSAVTQLTAGSAQDIRLCAPFMMKHSPQSTLMYCLHYRVVNVLKLCALFFFLPICPHKQTNH